MIKKSNSKRITREINSADLAKVQAGSVGYDRFDDWLAGRFKIESRFIPRRLYLKK